MGSNEFNSWHLWELENCYSSQVCWTRIELCSAKAQVRGGRVRLLCRGARWLYATEVMGDTGHHAGTCAFVSAGALSAGPAFVCEHM